MSARHISRVINALICVAMSINLVSCDSSADASSSENEVSTNVPQTTTALSTTTVSTDETKDETTETTVTTIELGDYGISLSEYREQKEQARLEKLNSMEQIGEVIINTKDAPLNLREKPDKESKSLDQIPKGTVVPYFGTEGEWVLVQYNGVKGYVYEKYVQVKEQQDGLYTSAYIGEVKINTKKDPLNMRENPDKNSKSLYKIPKGTIVPYLGMVNEWVFIEYQGELGYIHSDYVIFNP